MSHFSTIKTKIKDKSALLRALQVLGHNTDVDQKLENPVDHKHDEVVVQVAVGKDIGFRLNPSTKTYELVTDLQTWDQPVPVERFLDKLSQQYAVETITEAAKKDNFHVTQQTTNIDGSIELVVERWK
tara:strand:- start:63 stop:446 length:384 start_codon:yes stop_codon:yes gene_type:complete